MKKIFILLVIIGGLMEVSALSCTDLQKNLVRGAENSDVLALQNFLYEKGYLKATPNGFFGRGTLAAVRSYQGANGLSRSGQVFPLTREMIRKETCGTGQSIANTNSSIPKVTTSTTSTQTTVVAAPVIPKVLTAQEIRQRDVNTILTALYRAFRDTGSYPISYSTTTLGQEICTLGISECDGLVEIKSLVSPRYLTEIPRDPSLASSSKSGYTVHRSPETNDITIASSYKVGFTTVNASCNFAGGCSIKETDTTQKRPELETIDNAIFYNNGRQTEPLKITGKNFSEKGNSITLTSSLTRRVYTLGEFSSTDGKTISATTSFSYAELPCGVNCKERLPIGGYSLSVKNAGGESNYLYLTIKSVSVSSVANSPDASFTPNTTHRKLATISIGSEDALTLENLEFTMVGSSTVTSKITNFTLTDLLTGQIISGGPKFTLGSKSLANNNSKIYELYADIGEVETHLSGRVIFQGLFKIKGILNKNVTTIPIGQDFMITVSY